MQTDTTYIEGYDYRQINIIKREVPSFRAGIAMEMLLRHGLVAADDNEVAIGEDSAGRPKLTALGVKYVVKRACDIADEFYNQVKERGWMLSLPEPTTTKSKEDKSNA